SWYQLNFPICAASIKLHSLIQRDTLVNSAHGTNSTDVENRREQDTQPMRRGVRASTIISMALLLVFLQPAYANGEHVHVGGLFLVLLGGVVFLGGFVVVFYFLLRATPEEAHDEQESEE